LVTVIQGKPQRSYKVIGEVVGWSCARQAGTSPSQEDAIADLKLKAARVGADALVFVACQEKGVSLSKNCWRRVECRGDAIRWATTNP